MFARSLLALVLVLVLAPAAQARDATVTSFDGTRIQLSFFPSAAGGRAPTVLEGHGWGSSRDTDPNSASSELTGSVGLGPLRRAGFNVLTWDARGFGSSGGTVEVDSADAEARDVSALIDWLAQQPEARLDAPGDPRVGMTGVSYAGGIELVAAAVDQRIDAIAPIIAWHSLLTSLYKEDTVKSGWSGLLYALGLPASHGRLDPHVTSAFTTGAASGTLSADDRAWFDSRGPGALVTRIAVPTLLVEGTADTLFTLHEAIENYGILRAAGVPSKLVWFCGGHGLCLTGSGPAGHVEADVVAWLRRYLAADATVDTGPRFEWLADDATWRSAADYPPPAGAPIVATGAGTLVVDPADALSGTAISAGRALDALNVAVPPPSAAQQIVGEPQLTLTYAGTGTATHVFAQLVDETRNVVVGNQATPLPVTLDGAPHTLTRSLEAIAASAPAGARYTLQLTGGTQVYGPVHGAGALAFSAIRLELPTLGTGASAGAGAGAGAVLPAARTCVSRRRFVIHLRGRLRSARVYVGARRVRTTRRHGRLTAAIDLRGRARSTVTVRVVARDTHGRLVRQTRRYRTCAAG